MTMPEFAVPSAPAPPQQPVMSNGEFPPEFADEEVIFRRDGTVAWKVDGVRTLLRRPKFKELRVLNEEIATMAERSRSVREPLNDALREMTDPITAQITAMDDADPTTAKKLLVLERTLREVQSTPEFLDIQAKLRAQRDEADAELLDWFAESVLIRFGRPAPRAEQVADLPKWCIDATFTRELLEHWSSVPRRPGVV